MSKKRLSDVVNLALNEALSPDEPPLDVGYTPCALKDEILRCIRATNPIKLMHWVARYVVMYHAFPSHYQIIALMAEREITSGIEVPLPWNALSALSPNLLRLCTRYVTSPGCDQSLGEMFRLRRFLRRLKSAELQVLERGGRKVHRPRDACLPAWIVILSTSQEYTLSVGMCGRKSYYFFGTLAAYSVAPAKDSRSYVVSAWVLTRMTDSCGVVWDDIVAISWVDDCGSPWEETGRCTLPSQIYVKPDIPILDDRIKERDPDPGPVWDEIVLDRVPDEFAAEDQHSSDMGPVITFDSAVPHRSAVPGPMSDYAWTGETVESRTDKFKNDPEWQVDLTYKYSQDVAIGVHSFNFVKFYDVVITRSMPPVDLGVPKDEPVDPTIYTGWWDMTW